MSRKRPPVPTRTSWQKSEKGCWSLSLGERGCRVLVFQRKPKGMFYARTWHAGAPREHSLRTADRPAAEERAKSFWVSLVYDEAPSTSGPLTLETLWTFYQERCARYMANDTHTRATQRGQAEHLLSILGGATRCDRLTLNDMERYKLVRSRGGESLRNGGKSRPVGARTVAGDLQLLRAMLRWATEERTEDGEWLLKEFPLRGMKLPRAENVRRPVADFDKYLVLVEVARSLAETAKTRVGRLKWLRLELALFLAESTGRRVGSIRGLRWSDFSYEARQQCTGPNIHWAAEFDKKGREAYVDVPASLLRQVEEFRRRLRATGDGWLFPTADPAEPKTSDTLYQWLVDLMKHAGMEAAPGEAWHSYRRKWATERKSMPTVDVMHAGGWRDESTFRVYQHVDAETVRQVMAAPLKLRSGRIVGLGAETVEETMDAA